MLHSARLQTTPPSSPRQLAHFTACSAAQGERNFSLAAFENFSSTLRHLRIVFIGAVFIRAITIGDITIAAVTITAILEYREWMLMDLVRNSRYWPFGRKRGRGAAQLADHQAPWVRSRRVWRYFEVYSYHSI
ncbi:hypothetical protein, variant 2 [Verruconis gallopava]|uniref:Uncharacterized protein n=1 Tax=Verruconis gallopava TaxID=253628 RepID=A0A0D1ZWL7_9PEZI|nr:hypothetical protein, variant 2 [Verruconis gallopava]KIV98419.1 hypothetical protein, variant 2 [Verruconis gallopava]